MDPITIAGVVAGAAVLAGARRNFRIAGRNRLFGEFAAAHEGRVSREASVLGQSPEVALTHARLAAALTEYPEGLAPPEVFTEFRVDVGPVNPLGFRFEIYPETLGTSMSKLLGMQDVQVGDAPFDRLFVLKTNSEASLKRLLDQEARRLLRELSEVVPERGMQVRLDRGSLLVKRRGQMRDRDSLERFFGLACALADAVLAFLGARTGAELRAAADGIAFVPAGRPGGPVAPVCQICGDPITQHMVRCSSCRTAHHRPCWEYNGACSTYGCRSTRFVE